MSGARRPLLGCIADDFTGATDLANNLVRSGLSAVQTIGVPAAGQVDADAIVVALKSRTVLADVAVAESLRALRWLQAQGVEQVYFKYCSTFDSTDRGNIGPVTDALLDALEPGGGFTIACPAFPANQRTVFNGHLFVGELLLSESGMREHPLTPMTDANLVRVLQRQSRRTVGLVPYGVVGRGADAIGERFAALRADGVGIAVVDAISDDDLMRLGKALAGMPLVTAGSGVAIGLAQNWPARTRGAGATPADALPAAAGRRAIVSGSCSTATLAQIARFRSDGGASFAIYPLALAAGDDLVAAALAWSDRHETSGPLLFFASADARAVREVQARIGAAEAGALVEQALSAIAVGLVERGVRQLVVAGGETSGAVVQALGIERMTIGAQIDPGVPWTAAPSPVGGGVVLHLALKSGNFGGADFFTRAFARLAVP